MPSKMSGLVLAAGAAYGSSSACTAFSSIGAGPAGHAPQRAHASSISSSPQSATHQTTGAAGACAVGAAVAALAGARASKRSARAGLRANPRKFNEQFPCSSGPSSITVGKAGPSSFSILIAALKKAGLASALDGPGPLTVFAPDDAAFAEAGLSLDAVLALPNLADILKLHVVVGVIQGSKFKNQKIETLGGEVTMRKGVKGVEINKAVIKKPDCEIANGIMHIVGSVILP